MARKRDFRAEFRRLLAPTIIRALRDDALGRIPLKAAQRRQLRRMLRHGLIAQEIKAT